MKLLATSLVASVFGAPQGFQQQQQQQAIPQQVKCKDQITQVIYEPGDEWTQTRVFESGPTDGMEGQFRCKCLEDGGIQCSSLSLPCVFQDQGYQIGEKFNIMDYGNSHIDYKCACLGQPNGQIQCNEINAGCWDVHTQKKYALNSTFEQTRAEDDLIRDCECTGDETTRLIKCALTRYCKLNGRYLKIGERDVMESDTQTQECTCIEAGRTSCVIEAKPLKAQQIQDIPEETHDLDQVTYDSD